ncbi:MAG TPA: hypothetical protein VHM66_12620 [Solirubrobacterales bacterium]|nr:hypothetical protein [Solirubrobacterales bacterium]
MALFAGLSAGLIVLAHASTAPTALGRAVFAVWILAGLACGGACALAARRGLFAIAVPRRRLVSALFCGAFVTAAMALVALATVLYGVALIVDASGLAGAPNGPFEATSVSVSLAYQHLVMLTAAALAAVTTRRGWPTATQA